MTQRGVKPLSQAEINELRKLNYAHECDFCGADLKARAYFTSGCIICKSCKASTN